MIRLGTLAIGLAAVALCAAPAHSQGRMRVATGRVVAPTGAQVIRVPASQVANGRVAAVLQTATSAATVEGLLNGYPVPGLGFDYTHHAAVNRNLATRALIDPVTQQRLNRALQIRRNTPQLPIVVPAVINNIQIVVMPQPPIVILPVADETEGAAPPRRGSRDSGDEEYRERMKERYAVTLGEKERATEAPPAPPREVDDMVLIKRDGGLLFAVAFVVRNQRVVYVTRAGQRHTLPLDQFDIEATRDMNESLGTTVKLQ